jgi:hypothetical protein
MNVETTIYKPCETEPSQLTNTSRLKITSRQYISQDSKHCDRIVLDSDGGATTPDCFRAHAFDEENKS